MMRTAMKLIAALLFLCTPAFAQVANPAVTQSNLAETVCVPGWTKTVRPPVRYTNSVKFDIMRRHGIPQSKASDYELDHWMPLAAGGHPTDPKNLRLQAWTGLRGARAKDAIESQVHRELCAGKITLKQAQACWFKDWAKCP